MAPNELAGFPMVDYTASQINRLADTAPFVSSNRMAKGDIVVNRFALLGGAPHDTPPISHLAVLNAMAEVPGVDSNEYFVLGVTLQPVPAGTVLSSDLGDEVTAIDRSWICDVVFQTIWGGVFWLSPGDQEAAVRTALASWGGGYAPAVSMLVEEISREAESQTLAALEFWRVQPPLFYGKKGQAPVKSNANEPALGTLGVGLSYGLSDYPGELVPMKWSTSVVQPTPGGGTTTPTPTPQPGGAQPPASSSSSTQGLVIMGAAALAGYLLYRNFFSRRKR